MKLSIVTGLASLYLITMGISNAEEVNTYPIIPNIDTVVEELKEKWTKKFKMDGSCEINRNLFTASYETAIDKDRLRKKIKKENEKGTIITTENIQNFPYYDQSIKDFQSRIQNLKNVYGLQEQNELTCTTLSFFIGSMASIEYGDVDPKTLQIHTVFE